MTRAKRTVTGLGLVIGGALLGLLSLTALPWFRNDLGGVYLFGTKVSQLRETIAGIQGSDLGGVASFGVSPIYFRWLALVVLIVAALAAASTVGFDAALSRIAAAVAALLSLAGLVLFGFAIQVIRVDSAKLERFTGTASDPPGYLDYVRASGFGAWAMVLGLVAIGVGAVLASGGRDELRTLLADPEDEPPPSPPQPVREPEPEDEPKPGAEPEARRPDW